MFFNETKVLDSGSFFNLDEKLAPKNIRPNTNNHSPRQAYQSYNLMKEQQKKYSEIYKQKRLREDYRFFKDLIEK